MFAADSCPQLSYLRAEVPAGRMGLEPVLESGRIRRTVQTRGKVYQLGRDKCSKNISLWAPERWVFATL